MPLRDPPGSAFASRCHGPLAALVWLFSVCLAIAVVSTPRLARASLTASDAAPSQADDVVASAPRQESANAALPDTATARAMLERLPVKGRAPKTGYDRNAFGPSWPDVDGNGCDTRNDVLARDLHSVELAANGCRVHRGLLRDPYTGQELLYEYGGASEVDVDHVVPLANAWVTGAFRWDAPKRLLFANDPLNLLAVDAGANRAKGSADAATWLPKHKRFRCAYVKRQVAVKTAYALWVTPAERQAIERELERCAVHGEHEPSSRGAEPPDASSVDSSPTGRASSSSPPSPAPSHEDDEAPSASERSVYVRGYFRKDGTYVKPHRRRAPRRESRTSNSRKDPGSPPQNVV